MTEPPRLEPEPPPEDEVTSPPIPLPIPVLELDMLEAPLSPLPAHAMAGHHTGFCTLPCAIRRMAAMRAEAHIESRSDYRGVSNLPDQSQLATYPKLSAASISLELCAGAETHADKTSMAPDLEGSKMRGDG